MTGFDEGHDRPDRAEHSESTDSRVDDFPQGMLASPTRTRL